MASQSVEHAPSRFRARMVRGEPYHVGDLMITPKARVLGFGRGRANIGAESVSGTGAGFAIITPVAVVVAAPQGERCIPIADATAAALWRLGSLAVSILLLGACVRRLARRR